MMLSLCWLSSLLFAASVLLPTPTSAAPPPAAARSRLGVRQGKINDYSCRSTQHQNPIVILHGLGANKDEDINLLQAYLQGLNYCTFSLTYGAYPQFPYPVGGLKAIADSSQEVGAFVQQVKSKTNANKVDLVGHSEGAFQSLYAPKFAGIAGIVDKIVAIAPPAHGTTFGGATNIRDILGPFGKSLTDQILNTVGCAACADLLPNGTAVQRLNNGNIVQPGNTVTIIASKDDELVTPESATFVNEPGVRHIFVQDKGVCPLDPVGHLNEAYDTNVWNLVTNALNSTPDRKFVCSYGAPGK